MVVSCCQSYQKVNGIKSWMYACSLLFGLIIGGSYAVQNLTICVLAPKLSPYNDTDCTFFSLPIIKPAVTIGIEKVQSLKILPYVDIQVVYKNSHCSDIDATIAAFEMKDRKVHMFFGPMNDMAVNSVAQYASRWNIPLITPGAMSAFYFESKFDKHTLTRIGLSYDEVVRVVIDILHHYDWYKVKVIFEGRKRTPVFPEYYDIAGESFRTVMMERQYEAEINSYVSQFQSLEDLLTKKVGFTYSVVVLCASADSVREIMIKAHELNFDNGEYVFLNIDLFSSKEDSEKPWYRENDTTERNQKAKKAYEALMTVTLRKPTSPEYRNFSEEVKKRAGNDSFAYGEDEVNSFVGAFHDAVILYALALNETLANNRSITNGTEITHRMWNRTFEGITGTVSIDSNGDRNADYSLLDMDPHTGKFEVVANYFGKDKKYVPVSNTEIHWAGNRKSAPPDTPKCGFDGAKCPPEKPFPEYGIVIIVLGSLLVIVVIAAFFIYRHIKLEAELAEMNWRVRWDDIMFGTMENDRKMRRQGSNLSLTRTTNGEACAEGRVLIERSDKHELDWCQCGQCEATDAPAKRVCCRQLELYGIFQEGGTCITSNKEFREVVLNRDVLVAVFIHVMLIKRQRGVAPVNLNGCKLRLMATRQFLCWMHKGQRLKKEIRMAVPSCVSRAIRMEFPDDTNENSGGSLTDTSMTGVIPLENVA